MNLIAGTAGPTHHRVHELPSLLRPGDLLVVNATRVLPARLRGHKASGGAVEANSTWANEASASGSLSDSSASSSAT